MKQFTALWMTPRQLCPCRAGTSTGRAAPACVASSSCIWPGLPYGTIHQEELAQRIQAKDRSKASSDAGLFQDLLPGQRKLPFFRQPPRSRLPIPAGHQIASVT